MGMAECQLTPAGVKSIKTIGQLVTEHTLACDFSAYDVPLPLELQLILVSKGRSIVKGIDLALPMKASSASTQLGETTVGLDAARLYLGLATRLPKALGITQAMAEQVAGDFVQARQEFQVPSALCNTWLSLARAYCLSHGEAHLSEGLWSALLLLEKQRMRRCTEAGLL